MKKKIIIVGQSNTETSLYNYNKMYLIQKCLSNSDIEIKDDTGEYSNLISNLQVQVKQNDGEDYDR